MRKSLVLSAAAVLVLSACTNILDYDFNGVENRLMVAGILDASEDTHVVYLSISGQGTVKAVKNGSVKCYVNGSLVAEETLEFSEGQKKYLMDAFINQPGTGSWWEYDYSNQLPLAFTAKFTPGDEVKLEFDADDGKFKASSRVLSVPEPVSFTRVDTSRVVTENWEGMQDVCHTIEAELADIKGEKNWYCIETIKNARGLYTFCDEGPDVSLELKDVLLQGTDDLVLLDGNMPDNDIFSFSLMGRGDFAVFSDAMFADKSINLQMYYSEYAWDSAYQFEYGFSSLLSQEDSSRKIKTLTVSQRVNLYLSNCSKAVYAYLRALRALTSSNYLPQIMEPVTVPSNIDGGTGFVDIVYTTVRSFDLEDLKFEYLPEEGLFE